MKLRLFTFFFILFLSSCQQDTEESIYSGRQVEYDLYQASTLYQYSGKVLIKEFATGQLEINIQLIGEQGDESNFFPAHLHYHFYNAPEAPMAAMLNPVNQKSLNSTTVLNQLSDGTPLKYDDIDQFDGHIKVHLASDGPDYQVILVAGNIGSNAHLPIQIGE